VLQDVKGADIGEGPFERVRVGGEIPREGVQPAGTRLEDRGFAFVQPDGACRLLPERGQEVAPPAADVQDSADGESRDIVHPNSHFHGE
jgi:hypothetical protein